MKLSLATGYRTARWVRWELHRSPQGSFIMLGAGIPHRHRSITLWLYWG